MNKGKLFVIFFLSAVLLTGCKGKETKTKEPEYISVKEGENSPTTASYTEIDFVEGFAFDIRKQDFNDNYNNTFDVNPLSVLSLNTSPRSFYKVDYPYESVFPTDKSTLVSTKDVFLLYKPSECIYSLKTRTSYECSVLYYQDENVAHSVLSEYLKTYGLTNVTLSSEYSNSSFDTDKGCYIYTNYFDFYMGDTECLGVIYVYENDEGQTYFFAGGSKEQFTTEVLNHIVSSLKLSDEERSYIYDTGITTINYDYQGYLLTGNFADSLGLTVYADSHNYDITENFDIYELYFANPYTNCVVKYNIYPLSAPTASYDFLKAYPNGNIFEGTTAEQIVDADGNLWDVYTLTTDNQSNFFGRYKNTSVFLRMGEFECVAFQMWYNDEGLKTDMENSLNTVSITSGNSTMDNVSETMINTLNSFVPVEISTSTDANIGISVPTTEQNDVEGELVPSDNYFEDEGAE